MSIHMEAVGKRMKMSRENISLDKIDDYMPVLERIGAEYGKMALAMFAADEAVKAVRAENDKVREVGDENAHEIRQSWQETVAVLEKERDLLIAAKTQLALDMQNIINEHTDREAKSKAYIEELLDALASGNNELIKLRDKPETSRQLSKKKQRTGSRSTTYSCKKMSDCVVN